MSFKEDTGPTTAPAGVMDASGTGVKAMSSDAAGRLALASDETLAAVLVELRVISFLLAQRFGLTEDVAVLRADYDLASSNPF